jgi:phospholipase C
MENKAYSSIIGSADAPYENSLATACGVAENYFAVTHPSLPNYIAATSGSTQGVTDDNPPSSHPLLAASIFGQVSSASYQESMPANCTLIDAYPYAVRHNPEAYYLPQRTSCQTDNVAFSPFNATALPRFSFVTPNLCNDTHDCSVATGDAWLQANVPAILTTSDYRAGRTALFIAWDEDDSSASNHIPLLVLSASTKVGARSSTVFDHYSLLASTESMLGIGCLGLACGAASLRSAFGL